MRTLALAAAMALCLSGCSTPQQRAQQQQEEMNKMIAEYGPSCSQAGYVRDTDPWRNCIVQLGARNGADSGGFLRRFLAAGDVGEGDPVWGRALRWGAEAQRR